MPTCALSSPSCGRGPPGLTAILPALKPHLVELIGIAVTILIGQITPTSKCKRDIDIEACHREALHAALTTGTQLAFDRKLTTQAAVNLAVAYAQQSTPEATKPDTAVLKNLARAKIAAAGKCRASAWALTFKVAGRLDPW